MVRAAKLESESSRHKARAGKLKSEQCAKQRFRQAIPRRVGRYWRGSAPARGAAAGSVRGARRQPSSGNSPMPMVAATHRP